MPLITCSHCGKKFIRSPRRINEAEKRGWAKPYCSLKCLGSSRLLRRTYKCANPDCSNVFTRALGQLVKSQFLYCSRSCSATINNSKFPKRIAKIKTCQYCQTKFKGDNSNFCSKNCQSKNQIITSEIIIGQIQGFYKHNGRIPFKQEFHHYKAARCRFGTWNNAVKAAGFNPNPVKFAKKYIANDGHHCDSLAEKIIDDWLYARKIPHLRSFPYGQNRMTADFKVNDIFIEFLGLTGELESYDKLADRKKKLWKRQKLNVISIYPQHLFPKSRLDQILQPIVNKTTP